MATCLSLSSLLRRATDWEDLSWALAILNSGFTAKTKYQTQVPVWLTHTQTGKRGSPETTGHACEIGGNPFFGLRMLLMLLVQRPASNGWASFPEWPLVSWDVGCGVPTLMPTVGLETFGDQVESLECPGLQTHTQNWEGDTSFSHLRGFQNEFKNKFCTHHWEKQTRHGLKSIHFLSRACYLIVVTQDKPSPPPPMPQTTWHLGK